MTTALIERSVSNSTSSSNSPIMQNVASRQITPQISEPRTQIAPSPSQDKYWKQPHHYNAAGDDLVVIHVCDENRQVSKDFCCKRNILVRHMKYFERFLAENENGYDDIDISVHCDVEIFEWLMTYIHDPDKPPILEKSIVVSILISSEFLQMDSLVDFCLQYIAESLNEIIKLPIDLSCISEKLVNKLASLTHPKLLSQTKDRKDKILNKLYKRRVELDFSRKSGVKGGPRTIASSLTCCRYCGSIYLDNYASQLSCRSAPPVVDFRGRLARKHVALQGWSLTAYLKSLHAGGMSWDAIYWHVWAACLVFRSGDVMIGALEVDRYTVEPDGLSLRSSAAVSCNESNSATAEMSNTIASLGAVGSDQSNARFVLNCEDNVTAAKPDCKYFVKATTSEDCITLSGHITPTLNPMRSPEVLPTEILELLTSQMKFIVGAQHKTLIEGTLKNMLSASIQAEDNQTVDFCDILWGEMDRNRAEAEDERRRGRSRSPAKRQGQRDLLGRKVAHSVGSKPRSGNSPLDSGSLVEESGLSTGDRRSRSTSASLKGKVQNSAASSSGKGIALTSAKSTRNSFAGKSSAVGGVAAGNKVEGPAEGGSSGTPVRSASEDSRGGPLKDEVNTVVLRSLPAEVSRHVTSNKGHYRGNWCSPHPLQVQPSILSDIRSTILESGLSDARRFEWELDLLREYDEKRVERFESYLLGVRNPSIEAQIRASARNTKNQGTTNSAQPSGANSIPLPGGFRRKLDVAGSAGDNCLTNNAVAVLAALRTNGAESYYRDKGRQPYRLPI